MGKLTKHSFGYPVTYTNPTTGERVTGKIIDEAWAIEPEDFGPIAEHTMAGAKGRLLLNSWNGQAATSLSE